MIDVVIVGGGPGGLEAARCLASRGFRAEVFEEHDAIGAPVHCTGVLAAEVVEALRVPAPALLNALRTVRFVAPSGLDFSYTPERTEAVVIDRQAFDASLAEGACAAGAVLHRRRRIAGVEVGAGAVRVALEGEPPVEARAVVLACGAQYGLQRRLGLGFPRRFLQSAQMELPAAAPGDVELHFGSPIAPKGFAWAVPVARPGGTFARVGVMAAADAGLYFARMLARVREAWGIAVPPGAEPRRRMLPLAALRRTYADRLLVVGDAAGLVKPTTGGGIYYSVASGRAAAEVLADALAAGDLSAAALREYERRWRRLFQREFTAQEALRWLAEGMRDEDIERLFQLARTDGILPIVRRTARFNRHRDLILALLRHAPARRALMGRLAAGLVS